jgi:hypothetical protein
MYHNNTLQATATGLRTNQTYFPRIYVDGNNSSTAYFNFGQDPTFGGNKNTPATVNINGTNVTGPFAPSGDAAGTSGLFYYPPPAGAKALCTANLPEMTPTVNDDVPKDYFKAVTWTGQTTGGAYDHATGKVTTSMAPDLVWIKSRSSSYSNNINDSVRGVGRFLMSNIAVDEVNSSDGYNTNSTADANTILRSFDADGFNVGNNVNVNDPSNNMVAWCWKAGGAPDLTSSPTKPFAKNGVQHETLSAANITAGTITPTAMSVNTDAGFSIVKYGGSNTTGLLSSSVSSATIPHGLNDCEFCIIKNLKWSNTWVVSHRSIAPNVMSLQDTGIAGSTPPVDPAYGQITTLGSNTVTITRGSIRGDNVGEDFDAGGGQFEYIMYCWHSVEGYSKFGSYTGNEDPDGPFVYCGFRPAWVMVKRTDSANSWFILDNARNFYNSIDEYLAADDPAGEGTAANIADFVSNGVKIRGGSGYFGFNASGGTYIYMAFAEQPFNYANAR